MGKTNPTYHDVIESKEDEWQSFGRIFRAHKRDADGEVLEKMRRNADAGDYLNPTDSRVGMDLSLYVEAELERQQLRERVDELEEKLEQMKSYLASHDIKQEAE